MTVVQTAVEENVSPTVAPVVNDFTITVGTKNGSGSQTSNLTLLRALFKMGIPVNGRNVFPSNIQGLPTWYTIRASKDGFLARRDNQEIVVAMNPDSFEKDLASVEPGGAFYYADHLRFKIDRDDIVVYAFPAKALARASGAPPNFRDYVANMAYVGVLAQMLGIDMEKISQALEFHFGGKQKPIDLNYDIIKSAAEWAAENLEKRDPFRVEAMNATEGYIMTDGNTAAALGSVYGGVQLVSWYPITPATSVVEKLNVYLPKLRKDPETGKHTFAVVQTEDELAAIGIAIGGGWSGLRAMTSTSGPGISLMTEFAGLAYYAEIPVVVWNVQRMGPSTGLPTRTSQGDLTQAYFLGHGDTQNIILIPGSVNECFEFGWRAFDIAEQGQTPVIVLSDLDFGMNQWMTKPFEYPNEPITRGKIVWEEDLDKMTERFGRYHDTDGDGIPYRTVPGNRHENSAWFARGTGHDEYAGYSEEPDVWDASQKRLQQKFETMRPRLPKPEISLMDDAKLGVIAYGSMDPAVDEARVYLADAGVKTDYLRMRALPFSDEVEQFLVSHDRTYVVEMNHHGQMCQLLTMEYPQHAASLVSLPHNTGLSPSAAWIMNAILAKEEE